MRCYRCLLDHCIGARGQTGRHVNADLLAVFRLMMNSNFVDCSTGKSAGFAPFGSNRSFDWNAKRHPERLCQELDLLLRDA